MTGQVAWAVPPLANAKVTNTGGVEASRGEILVTRRGEVPIAVKAHNLQVTVSYIYIFFFRYCMYVMTSFVSPVA